MQKNKWIFVTSGDGGIGAGIVKRLAGEGYKVIFTYRSQKDRALTLTNDVQNVGGKCLCYFCDVREHQLVQQLCSSLIKEHGAPYGVINNSGTKNDKLLINTEIDEWHNVINTNLNGPFYIIRAFLPSMITAGNGCVITISSVSALRGNAGQTAYSASKAAHEGLVKSLAREVGIFNIRVNNIAPGLIETNMIDSLAQKRIKLILAQTTLKKFGSIDDISQTISFLLGDGGNYITGQNIVVDGGLSV